MKKQTIQRIIKEEIYIKRAWDIVNKNLLKEWNFNKKINTNAQAKSGIKEYIKTEEEIDILLEQISATTQMIAEKQFGNAKIEKQIETYMREYNKSKIVVAGKMAKITTVEQTKKENPKYKALFELALKDVNEQRQKALLRLKEKMKKIKTWKEKLYSGIIPAEEHVNEGIIKDLMDKLKNVVNKIVEVVKEYIGDLKEILNANNKLNSACDKYIKALEKE